MKTLGAVLGTVATLTIACSTMASQDSLQPGADDERTWTSVERSRLSSSLITWSNAAAPFKKYLLIKDGDFLCGIRFINFRRGQDARPASFWSSGEETLISVYEWQLLFKTDDKVRAIGQGKGTVKFTAPHGFGHLIIGGGYENVKCGDRKFGWQYPDAINFSQMPNSDMKLAPTRWETIEEIRLNDPRLVWYSFDQSRKPIRIPLDKL